MSNDAWTCTPTGPELRSGIVLSPVVLNASGTRASFDIAESTTRDLVRIFIFEKTAKDLFDDVLARPPAIGDVVETIGVGQVSTHGGIGYLQHVSRAVVRLSVAAE